MYPINIEQALTKFRENFNGRGSLDEARMFFLNNLRSEVGNFTFLLFLEEKYPILRDMFYLKYFSDPKLPERYLLTITDEELSKIDQVGQVILEVAISNAMASNRKLGLYLDDNHAWLLAAIKLHNRLTRIYPNCRTIEKQLEGKIKLPSHLKIKTYVTDYLETAPKVIWQDILLNLQDPEKILPGLVKLDSLLKEKYLRNGLIEPQNKPQKSLVVTAAGLFYPHYAKPTCSRDFLAETILEYLFENHGVENEEITVFSGFVDGDKANPYVAEHGVFFEDPRVGLSMLHGTHSHAIQLFLIATLIERKIILRDLKTVLRELIQKNSEGIVEWSLTIDTHVRTEDSKFNVYGFIHPYSVQNVLINWPTLQVHTAAPLAGLPYLVNQMQSIFHNQMTEMIADILKNPGHRSLKHYSTKKTIDAIYNALILYNSGFHNHFEQSYPFGVKTHEPGIYTIPTKENDQRFSHTATVLPEEGRKHDDIEDYAFPSSQGQTRSWFKSQSLDFLAPDGVSQDYCDEYLSYSPYSVLYKGLNGITYYGLLEKFIALVSKQMGNNNALLQGKFRRYSFLSSNPFKNLKKQIPIFKAALLSLFTSQFSSYPEEAVTLGGIIEALYIEGQTPDPTIPPFILGIYAWMLLEILEHYPIHRETIRKKIIKGELFDVINTINTFCFEVKHQETLPTLLLREINSHISSFTYNLLYVKEDPSYFTQLCHYLYQEWKSNRIPYSLEKGDVVRVEEPGCINDQGAQNWISKETNFNGLVDFDYIEGGFSFY